MTVSPARYRQISVVALCLLIVIIVTGAAVRLTGSGLGCSDWPNCNSQRFVDVSNRHAAIEQINRLFTGLVSLVVITAALASLRRQPRRRDLLQLSLGLVVGVGAQGLIGAAVVWLHLHPNTVQLHMLVSLVLVAVAMVLVHRAGLPDDPAERTPPPLSLATVRWLWAGGAVTVVAILFGTVVTGAGPHAGDEDIERLNVSIPAVARLHGIAVMVAVATMLAVALRLRGRPAERRFVGERLTVWVFVAALQAAIGYIQYFNGVPELLVGLHVLGASVLWALTVGLLAVAGRPRTR